MSPESSGSVGSYALQKSGDIERPVDLARLLKAFGTSLKVAHDVVQRIALGDRVCVELTLVEQRALQREFKELGVAATPIGCPSVNVAAVRNNLEMTVGECALRFGLDPDRVRAWEEGNASPGSAVQILLAVIQHAPEVVDRVMTGESAAPRRKSAGDIHNGM